MTAAQFLGFFSVLAPVVEPMIMSLEQTKVQPELKALIATVSNPDLKLLLTTLDSALDSFAQAEIAKI